MRARSIFHAAALLSLALFIGRLSGLLREMLLAARAGTSGVADGAVLVLTLPDFMVGLFLAGGLNAAIIPALTRAQGRDAKALLWRLFAVVLVGFGAIALLFGVFAEMVWAAMAPTLNFDILPGFRFAFAFSLLALPIAAAVGVSTAWLNVAGKFSISGLSVLAFNLVICLFLGFFEVGGNWLVWFSAAVVLAMTIRFCSQLAFMPEAFSGIGWRMEIEPRGLLGQFIVGVLGYAIIVAAPIVFRSLYAGFGEGYLARFNYALKLFELPSALIVAPVVAVLLPRLSTAHFASDGEFASVFRAGFMASLALASAISIVGWVFMKPAVEILYQRGSVTSADAVEISEVARLLLASLPLYAAAQVTIAALSAQMRQTSVFLATVTALALSLLVTIGLTALPNAAAIAIPAGFATFSFFAALISLLLVLGQAQRELSWIAGRVGLLVLQLVPLAALYLIAGPYFLSESVWLVVLVAVIATAMLGLAVSNHIMPLVRLRIARSEPQTDLT